MKKRLKTVKNIEKHPKYQKYINALLGDSLPFFQEMNARPVVAPYPYTSSNSLIDVIIKLEGINNELVPKDSRFDLSVDSLGPKEGDNFKKAIGGYSLVVRNIATANALSIFTPQYKVEDIAYTYLKTYLNSRISILERLAPSEIVDTMEVNDEVKLLGPNELGMIKMTFLQNLKNYDCDQMSEVFMGLLYGFAEYKIKNVFKATDMVKIINHTIGLEPTSSSHEIEMFNEFSEFCQEHRVDHHELFRTIITVLEEPYHHQEGYIPNILYSAAYLRVDVDEHAWLKQFSRVLDVRDPIQLRKIVLALMMFREMNSKTPYMHALSYEYYFHHFLAKYLNVIQTNLMILNQDDGLIASYCKHILANSSFSSDVITLSLKIDEIISKSQILSNDVKEYTVTYRRILRKLKENLPKIEFHKFTKLGLVEYYLPTFDGYIQVVDKVNHLYFKKDLLDAKSELRSRLFKKELGIYYEVSSPEEIPYTLEIIKKRIKVETPKVKRIFPFIPSALPHHRSLRNFKQIQKIKKQSKSAVSLNKEAPRKRKSFNHLINSKFKFKMIQENKEEMLKSQLHDLIPLKLSEISKEQGRINKEARDLLKQQKAEIQSKIHPSKIKSPIFDPTKIDEKEFDPKNLTQNDLADEYISFIDQDLRSESFQKELNEVLNDSKMNATDRVMTAPIKRQKGNGSERSKNEKISTKDLKKKQEKTSQLSKNLSPSKQIKSKDSEEKVIDIPTLTPKQRENLLNFWKYHRHQEKETKLHEKRVLVEFDPLTESFSENIDKEILVEDQKSKGPKIQSSSNGSIFDANRIAKTYKVIQPQIQHSSPSPWRISQIHFDKSNKNTSVDANQKKQKSKLGNEETSSLIGDF